MTVTTVRPCDGVTVRPSGGVRGRGCGLIWVDEDFVIRTADLTENNIDVFVEEFAGSSFVGRPFEELRKEFSVQTAPLLERRCLSIGAEGKMIEESFNLLNYEYWIIGDRRFLLSRKRNTNLGDLVARWRRSLVHASFDWSNDPVSIMFAQAAQALEEQDNYVYPGIAPIDLEALPEKFPGLRAGRDALAFPSLSQITLDQAWARSNTQRTFSTEQSN